MKHAENRFASKAFVVILLAMAFISNCFGDERIDPTNDFYDNEPTMDLPVGTITVEGEIANPGVVDYKTLQLHSVIAKETILQDNKDVFIGAYRYDGYSLYDILNNRRYQKKNSKEFPGCIDLFVIVENKAGQKAVFSWGEIYYPVNRHKIIIAAKVMHIVPSKTKEQWPLPGKSKLVAATDLLTERNISDPIKITVFSFPRSYKGKKGLKPLIADTLYIVENDRTMVKLTSLPSVCRADVYKNVFYGRGTGIHGISSFEGALLKDIIAGYFPLSVHNLQSALFCLGAPDGYRCVFTYSEICNRNDQAEILLQELKSGEEGGRFKLFSACDFFSDRALKAVNEIYCMYFK